MKPQYIRYGLSLDYIPKWGIQQALREIYQNYIDFGDYTEEVLPLVSTIKDVEHVEVTLRNNWNPEDFNFLVIGGSKKDDTKIGKYGEGLKMAFLVFLRTGIEASMEFGYHSIHPVKSDNKLLGADTYSIKISNLSENNEGFTTTFIIPTTEYNTFKTKIVDKTKILFSCDYGDIVDYPAGQVFIGGIWVCNLTNFGKAYDFKPKHIPINRDREVPYSWDVESIASLIQAAHGILTAKDLSNDDSRYLQKVPETVKKTLKPVIVESNIQFVTDEGDIIPKQFTDKLINSGEFKEEIQTLKEADDISDTEAITNFKNKWLKYNTEAQMDFDLLIKKLNKL